MPFAKALILVAAACCLASCTDHACDATALQAAEATVDATPASLRAAAAATSLVSACKAALPKEYADWLAAAAAAAAAAKRPPGSPAPKSLRMLVEASPRLWTAACPTGAGLLAKLETGPGAEALREIWRRCHFDELGLATEDDFVATDGNPNLGIEATVLAPALHAWLSKANGEPATHLVRALAGIPAPVRFVESEDLRFPTSSLTSATLSFDRLVAVTRSKVLFDGQTVCSLSGGKVDAGCASALEATSPKQRGNDLTAVLLDRRTPFSDVWAVFQALRRAGADPALLVRGQRGWTELRGPSAKDRLGKIGFGPGGSELRRHVHVGEAGFVISSALGGELPDRPARRDFAALSDQLRPMTAGGHAHLSFSADPAVTLEELVSAMDACWAHRFPGPMLDEQVLTEPPPGPVPLPESAPTPELTATCHLDKGKCDAKAITDFVAGHREELGRCFKRTGQSTGAFELRFTVDRTGRVSKLSVGGLWHYVLLGCLSDDVTAWRLPGPADECVVECRVLTGRQQQPSSR